MTFLKSIWADLVEKRLWPVAVALLAAMVAVPLVLGPGSAPTAAVPPAGSDGETAGLRAPVGQVSLESAVPVRLDRAGKVRNPFIQRVAARAKAQAVAAAPEAKPDAAPASSSGGSSAGDPSLSGGSPSGGATPRPSGPTGPATQAPAKPKADPQDDYVVALRFGKVDTKRTTREVRRLTPLPSAENPFFVQLGVLSDEKTVVFLLSSDVTATGDGACKPRASSCETLELVKGDTEFLEVTSEGGEVTRYQLDLVRVSKEASTETSTALAARTGAEADEDDLGTDAYVYDEDEGTLSRVEDPAEDAAEAAEDAAAEGTDPVADGAAAVANARRVTRGVVWDRPVPLPPALRP